MKKFLFGMVVLSPFLFSQSIILDPCIDTTAWKTFQSAGVVVTQRPDGEMSTRALRFDVHFTKGSGYGGVFRNFNQSLPENYQINFMMKATVPINNFEIKVSDDSLGETIWWVNNKNYSYPAEWKRYVLKKRHLSFAWGTHAVKFPDVLKRFEFVVTAGSGGNGSVWVKDLELIPIPLPPNPLPKPIVMASSSKASAKNILPNVRGVWKSTSSKNEWIEIDFGCHREFGGVRMHWDQSLAGLNYDVLGSLDGKRYDTLYSVRNGTSGNVLLFTPEAESRFLRVTLKDNYFKKNFILEEVSIVPSESLSTPNNYFEFLAANAPRGLYPRYFLKQQSYWTVVGVPLDTKEALFSEDGMFEVDKRKFSVEPFVVSNGKILSWANGTNAQTLEEDYIPIPTVTRSYENFTLKITLLARGEAGQSAIMARYVVKNISSLAQKGTLVLALRPFQVNPASQWLNYDGGFAKTEQIKIEGQKANVDDKTVIVSASPISSSTATIDQGDIVEQLANKKELSSAAASSSAGMASAVFQYSFNLKPNDSLVVIAAVPFYQEGNIWDTTSPTPLQFQNELNHERSFWKRRLNTVKFTLPKEAQRYIDIMRSNLGYILINKDRFGFQPGSRSYERSWIRDGSMTSDALLKLGIQDEPKKFIEWYSSYQYENGMVPCVVDTRGPDPVPENDSHGELIFACMEYFRFTNDTSFLRERWNNISAAAEYIQKLRAQRMTKEYEFANDEKKSFYGLVTESISHEGYSDKARHSYWDNFFALKGLKDAASAAATLGLTDESKKYDSIAKAYRQDFYRSIAQSMKNHNVQYIPGCAELGDFDATSTSISLYPAGEIKFLPHDPLHFTFDKYFSWFEQRAKNKINWNEYTPYEIRTVGTFLYLGQKDRAHYLLEWFLHDQRPQGWNHWAEVVDHNERHARFIGDMPHTWVGSDYINALRAMFVYEIDDDTAIVVGAGLRDSWVKEGLSIENLPTHYGKISYSISTDSVQTVHFQLNGTIDTRHTKILVPISLLSVSLKRSKVNGELVTARDGFVTIKSLPAVLDLEY